MDDRSEHWTGGGPVMTRMDREELGALGARAKATVADSAPLGLLGFGTATFVAGTILAGWFPPAAKTLMVAAPVLLVFGGLAQFIAAMWSYRRVDILGATAFGSFGAFNVTYAFILFLEQLKVLPHALLAGNGNNGFSALGVMVAWFAAIALFLSFAALARNLALWVVLFALALAYAFIACGLFAGNTPTGPAHILMAIGGWCAIISSAAAYYTAAGIVINSEFKRLVLPLGAAVRSAVPEPRRRREMSG